MGGAGVVGCRGARRATDDCARAGPRVRWRASGPGRGCGRRRFRRTADRAVSSRLGLGLFLHFADDAVVVRQGGALIGTPLDGAVNTDLLASIGLSITSSSRCTCRSASSTRVTPAPRRSSRRAASAICASYRRSASSAAATPPWGGFSAQHCPSRSRPETISPCAVVRRDRRAAASFRALSGPAGDRRKRGIRVSAQRILFARR